MQKPIIILYQAFGSIKVHKQVLFSILTLYYHLQGSFDNIRVVVYTDKESFFEKFKDCFPLTLVPLTTNLLNEYKGEHNFIHRIKICIIKDCFVKYNNNLLYLDSDTYFTKNPKELFQKIEDGYSIMNSDDYDLTNADLLYENNDWLSIRRAIKNYNYLVDETLLSIPLTTRMWNAGVIGMNVKNVHLLEPVLKLTDQIYSNRKVFTAEQFSFSYILQNRTELISSGDVIFHYWPNHIGQYWKDAYNQQLNLFFKRNLNNDIKNLALLSFRLTQNHEYIIKISKDSFLHKIIKRIKLIIKVAKDGHL